MKKISAWDKFEYLQDNNLEYLNTREEFKDMDSLERKVNEIKNSKDILVDVIYDKKEKVVYLIKKDGYSLAFDGYHFYYCPNQSLDDIIESALLECNEIESVCKFYCRKWLEVTSLSDKEKSLVNEFINYVKIIMK